MALVLDVKLYSSFFVDGSRYVVTRIIRPAGFRISSRNRDWTVRAGTSPTLMGGGVSFLAGEPCDSNSIKVIIDAPEEVSIMRGNKYWNEHFGKRVSDVRD